MSRQWGVCLSILIGLGIVVADTLPARATPQDIPLTNSDFQLPGPGPGPPGTRTYAFDTSGAPIPGIIPGWTFPGPGTETFGHPERLGDSGTEPTSGPDDFAMLLSMHDGVAYQVSSFELETIAPAEQYVFSFDAFNIFTIDSDFVSLLDSCQLTARITYGAARTTLDTFVVEPEISYTTYEYVIPADSPLLTAPRLGEVLGIEFAVTSSELDPQVDKSWVHIDNVKMEIVDTSIPEPASLLLLGLGLGFLPLWRQRW